MYAYCLFCDTQRCKTIASNIERNTEYRAFSPQIIKRQRKEGINQEIYYDLFPGYVFLYSETKINEFKDLLIIDGVIRLLGETENGYCLTGGDRDFALQLLRKNGVIGVFKALRIGDKVVLDDPTFFGCEGRITKIDYRKQRARVDFTFSKMNCYMWIACDFTAE